MATPNDLSALVASLAAVQQSLVTLTTEVNAVRTGQQELAQAQARLEEDMHEVSEAAYAAALAVEGGEQAPGAANVQVPGGVPVAGNSGPGALAGAQGQAGFGHIPVSTPLLDQDHLPMQEDSVGAPSIQTTGNPHGLGAAKFPPPPPYSGEKDPAEFLVKMDSYFELVNILPVKQVVAAANSLSSAALAWYQAWRKTNPLPTYDDFKQGLIREFRRPNYEEEQRAKFMALTQTGKVAGYIQKTRMILHEIVTPIDESTKRHVFITGLKPLLRKEVMLKEPATLNDAFYYASKYEGLLDSANPQRSTISSTAVTTLAGSSQLNRRSISSSNPRRPSPNQGANNRTGTPASTTESRPRVPKDACLHCGKTGHWKRDCPEFAKAKVNLMDAAKNEHKASDMAGSKP